MLTTTDRRIQVVGDDQTTEFNFEFRAWEQSQIKVYQADEDAVWSDIDITSTCEITLNDDGTGTVKFSSAPKAGVTIAIVREMPFIQEDEYINGTRFNPEEIEDRFDQDCAERQELLDGVNRAIKVPNTGTQTPEEVYEQLVNSSLLVEQWIDRINEMYEEIIALYGQFKGEIGEQGYMANNEVSWDYNAEDTANEAAAETDVVVDIPEGLQYRKGMNQLHVDVDGVVVAVDKDYEEVEPKDDNEYSTQLRFKVPLHDGQRIHVHTSFLGTVDYEEQLKAFEEAAKEVEEQIKEAQQRVEDFNREVDQKIEESKRQLEEQTNQAIDEAEERVNSVITEAYQVLEDVSELMGDANAINELREQSFLLTQQLSQYSALPYQICQLNACTCAISNTICAYTTPQDCTCTLSTNYNCNCCVELPICYYPNTCTLHIAIDGVVLSCCDYCEVTNGTDGNGSGQSCQIQTSVCLYSGQELHAWTEPYWCNNINYTAPEQVTSCEYEGCCYECCTTSAITVSDNSCGCVLYSCFICNCGDNGGAICNQSNLFVCESEFYCNCACGEASVEDDEEGTDPHGNGGAIAVLGDGYTYLSNSCFEGNCACTDGGMLYASCGETFASSITACCNTANCHGGAIALTAVTCLNYNCGTLEGNCATTGSGGALCATCTCLAISGGSISNNCACECGGALALFNCSRAIVCNACIMNNTASYGGGIYVCDNSRAYIYCSYFEGNCDHCIGESEDVEEPGDPPEGEPGEPPEEPSAEAAEDNDGDEEEPFIPMGYDVYLDCNSCTILCNVIFGHSEETDGSGEATEESELIVADEEASEATTCGGVYIGCGSCATVSGTTYLCNGLICIPSDGYLTVNGCLILCDSYICYINECGCVTCGSQGCIDCCGSSCVCCVQQQEEEPEEPPEDDNDDDDEGGSNEEGGGTNGDQGETGEQGSEDSSDQ